MIDICERARDWLEAEGFKDVHVKRLDQFTGKEGIVIRPFPTTTTDHYYDRSTSQTYVYQVTVRRRSEAKAIEDCFAVANTLDGAYLPSKNGSYGFVDQEIYTEPQEQELEEANYYAWQVRMVATITRD